MIQAKIIADSVNELGFRCTSFVLDFPRYLLAEFNTHRALSRNSASSRAVPFEKMLESVKNNPFIPHAWMKEHKGMQGTEYFENSESFEREWLYARSEAVKQAKSLNEMGLTKQMVNRLLEPFMYHKTICTATDYLNFFALRCEKGADIHFQILANVMLDKMRISNPIELSHRQWHIPFGDSFDERRLVELLEKEDYNHISINDLKLMIATARCARVSYINYEGKDDYESDIKLYNTLLSSGHMSPFEHCAMALDNDLRYGNFQGFLQLRKQILGENKKFSI